jgi:hypothetical protein
VTGKNEKSGATAAHPYTLMGAVRHDGRMPWHQAGRRPCTANVLPGSRYCWHHKPDHTEERRRNASRAATLGNSKIGAEIRSTRLLVRDIVELTITNELNPLVRKRLTEVVQLLQVYARLAELEISVEARPRVGDVALPEDIGERVRQWTEGEESEMQKGKELAEELSQTMEVRGHDPVSIREAMGS